MKSICIRVEDETHRQLKCVLLYRGSSLQDYMVGLLKQDIDRQVRDLMHSDTTGTATKLFQRVGIPSK